MEKRIPTSSKSSPLPSDYLKMVKDLFTDHFQEGLKKYCELKPGSEFDVSGAVYADEIVLAVSLGTEGQLAATTLYASSDFDPKASAPTIQDLLGACVDALGVAIEELLNPAEPAKLEQLADDSLSALETAPFHWSEVEADKRKIYIKVDKANIKIEQLADDWLAKHDPDFKKDLEEEQKQTEELFFTGPKKKSSIEN